MAGQDGADVPRGEVTTSGSYGRDVLDAARYALIGAVLVGGAAVNFAVLDTVRGRTAAAGFFSKFGPVTPSMGVDFAHFLSYILLGFSALAFLMVAYNGVVRPVRRATGTLDSAGNGGSDGSRERICIETTDGTQTVAADAVCIDCGDRAIGVLSTAFEDSTPSEVLPVCPMHLHERRDEFEEQSQRVEVETFA